MMANEASTHSAKSTVMKNIRDKVLRFLGLFWSFLFLFLISATLQGFVFSYLWLWFIVPLGLPKVSILHAFGIYILLDFVSYHYNDYRKNEQVGLITSVNYILIRPLIVFTIGFILHFFL